MHIEIIDCNCRFPGHHFHTVEQMYQTASATTESGQLHDRSRNWDLDFVILWPKRSVAPAPKRSPADRRQAQRRHRQELAQARLGEPLRAVGPG